ncbi:hypothetical protein PFICI_08179 [Pestalotiopsis fici W106-1]|uniref:G-protein coupled receptors family 1 profile domain-containing protein n=1 Tax=Pestalotiopsis fici (strain W106-1 / CGMCC3.15140) TaxID=1229662 RepID=W3X3J8_PESFW|nr:uncharacterized protein PFICI_08179 [Pestalotiopsis fici W106-1]ETS80650.1 hypothetical protein PFICI_08179 [Pestalotiopsis fici W106-1]
MGLYFEQSWAILSTVGLVNVLYGLVVISITKLSIVVLIPIIVSAAGAVANGLCYYAFYSDHPLTNTLVASGFADIFWLIQEVGVSFYSYAILIKLLKSRSRMVFCILFWTVVSAIITVRLVILVGRIKIIQDPDTKYQQSVNYLHVGYFSLIAVLECLSAFFLLRKFASAQRASIDTLLNTSLLQHLMRSTETRVASLALLGISRAITYAFCPSLPQALTTAGQVDRFIYTLECMFPLMMYIDILACKIKFTDRSNMELPRVQSFRSDHVRLDSSEQATPRLLQRQFDRGTEIKEDGIKGDE